MVRIEELDADAVEEWTNSRMFSKGGTQKATLVVVEDALEGGN